MHVREIMTSQVAVIGIVAEADVLRSRLSQDLRPHLRRDNADPPIPPLLARGVMTAPVRTVPAAADVADLASFLDEGLRSVPVLQRDRLVGIVSRRDDDLRAPARPDDEIEREVRRLVDSYTGQAQGWTVEVSEGVVSLTGPIASPSQAPPPPAAGDAALADIADTDAAEATAVRTLARTVPGVVAVR